MGLLQIFLSIAVLFPLGSSPVFAKSALSNQRNGNVDCKTEILKGKYEMVKSENYDEYLKAIGIGFTDRNLANSEEPTIEVTEKYFFKTITPFKVTDLEFENGQPFLEETMDGRNVKTTITRNGNTFKQTQPFGKTTTSISRTFDDGTLTVVFEADGVTSTRVYKRA